MDGIDVGERIHFARDVNHVRVVERAHHVRDRVHLADVREELVAEAFALGGAGHQPGDVDEFDRGRHHALRLRDRRDRIEMPMFGSMVQNG